MWKMYQRAAERNAQLPRYRGHFGGQRATCAGNLSGTASSRRESTWRPCLIRTKPNNSTRPTSHPPGAIFSFSDELTKLKGAAELLKAIPLAEKQMGRPLAVTIAGDGPERKHLEEFARRNQTQGGIHRLDQKQPEGGIVSKADLLVVPSLWPEPFGLVGIEAGTHGVPAVAYDVGGISDWLIAGYSGELAPGNPPTVEGSGGGHLPGPLRAIPLRRPVREVPARWLPGLPWPPTCPSWKARSKAAADARGAAEAIHADA